jgi:hypothetical protein
MPRRRQVEESYTVQKNSIEFNISEYFYGPVKKINIFAIKGLMENFQQFAGQKLVIESETMSVFSLSVSTYPYIRQPQWVDMELMELGEPAGSVPDPMNDILFLTRYPNAQVYFAYFFINEFSQLSFITSIQPLIVKDNAQI